MGQWSKWTNVLKWSIKQLNRSYYCPHQRFQPQQIICICADICTFPDLHYRHEQTSAPFDKLPIWSKERGAERTFPLLGGHFVDIFCFFVVAKRYFFLAGKGLCYVVVPCFCRDMSFVAFTRFFGLILMQTFMQTLRILCRYCADFCTKKCSLEALFWSLGSKAEAPTCGCFEGTSTSLRVPGDAKMVLELAFKLKNRVINQGRMFSTDIQPCGSS